jgi:hypothetical protein
MRFAVMTLLVFAAGAWARKSIPAMFGAGLVTLALEMFVFSWVGVGWTVWGLILVPGLLSCWVAAKHRIGNLATQQPSNLLILIPIAIFAITVLSATITSGDFLFFWGTKGQRFAQAGMIDVAFLRDPAHAVMHPEYPPLVPLYYAWTMLGSTELNWFLAMASAILFLAFAAWETRSALFASLFALLFIRNDVAGNAEPALIFFEVVALAALLAKNDIIAAIALCGVALTKIEGAVFVVIVILLLGRRWKVALPPLLTLAAWWIFAKTNGLFGASDPRYAFSFAYIWPSVKQLAQQMSFGLWYLPWIAIAAWWRTDNPVCPEDPGQARLPVLHLAAALAFLAFMVLTYARPEAHMEWSAQRVLMTPLVLFFFSAITRNS